MFDNLIMSMNSKLKKVISGLETNEGKIDEISTDVVSIQSTSDDIKALIGTEIATQLSTLQSNIIAAMNSSSGGVVKSVQRGTTTSTTVTLSQSVDPNKCMVLIDNQYAATNLAVVTGGNDVNYRLSGVPVMSYCTSLTATKLTITQNTTYQGKRGLNSSSWSEFTTLTGVVSWQVIEFY